MARPLEGLRVVDASSGIAGPMAAMFLADFGADVVKVEPPQGDPARAQAGFAMWNRNKRGITIDDGKAADRERLGGLLRGADACVFSASIEALRERQLDPDTLTGLNPSLVYLHAGPFTASAPWAGAAESEALTEAAAGVAMEQYGFEAVPVDGLYPHVLYAQAIWGATTTTAALIERETSGFGQTVTVGAMHATMMAMSGQITHQPGAAHVDAPGGPGGPIPFYRLYEGSDGQWLFMATLTPKFFMAAFEELGVMEILQDERLGGEPLAMALPENAPWVIERIQAAFRARPRDEWYTALRARGCPVAPVNDRDDWLDHAQVAAIGMRVEVEDPEHGTVVMPGIPINLTRAPGAVRTPAPALGQHDDRLETWEAKAVPAGEAPVREGPLTDVRVLDLGSVIAGTYAGSLLAELGADVIKVEAPAGDLLRMFAPTFVGYNKGKRSISIDLRSDAGRQVFYDLMKRADLVIDNYRMGVLERLGVHYDTLHTINPEIITVSVTGYGEGGPLMEAPGWDPLLQAWSGMMHAQGGQSDPVFFTLPVNDISTACMATLGGLLAVLHRKRGGAGQRVWTSLAGQSCIMQSGELVRYRDCPPSPRGGRDHPGSGALDRYYQASDGWVRLQARGEDAMAILQRARFLPPQVEAGEDALTAALQASIAVLPAAEAAKRLNAAGIAAAQARTLQQLSTDPLYEGSEVVHLSAPEGGAAFFSCGRYASLSRTERSDVLYPPGLGEHTLEILAEAGVDDGRTGDLLAAEAIVVGEPFRIPPTP